MLLSNGSMLTPTPFAVAICKY